MGLRCFRPISEVGSFQILVGQRATAKVDIVLYLLTGVYEHRPQSYHMVTALSPLYTPGTPRPHDVGSLGPTTFTYEVFQRF